MVTFEFIEGEPDAVEAKKEPIVHMTQHNFDRLCFKAASAEGKVKKLEARLELWRKSEEGTLAQMAETNERFQGALSKITELEAQLAEADGHIAHWQGLYQSACETLKTERDRAEQAEARADALQKELNHWKSEFIREGSMPNSEINARIEAYSQRIEQAEARAEAAEKELEEAKKPYLGAEPPAMRIARLEAALTGVKDKLKQAEARAADLAKALEDVSQSREFIGKRLDMAVNRNASLRAALEKISERRFRCADKNCYASDVAAAALNPDTRQEGEEYSCGYNTVSGAFHKPGCAGECGIMNPSEAVKRRRIERRKAKSALRRSEGGGE